MFEYFYTGGYTRDAFFGVVPRKEIESMGRSKEKAGRSGSSARM